MSLSIESIALNRLAFGPSDSDLAHIQKLGLRRWVKEQLAPDATDGDDCLRRLNQATFRIHYGAGKDYPALDESRSLATLNLPIQDIWHLTDNKLPLAGQERTRPRVDVASATIIRAIYSPWQLKEVLCDFWHNHFSVNASDTPVAVALPSYDRDVIRPHCFGNFRELLESVASSTAMLYFLNNRSSRAGFANENYARELFELHGLGRENYLNEFYNRWRDVPGALKSRPIGYIDQDVYEAARAFTGWTVEDGSSLGGNDHLPSTGKFVYVESWHDSYQKRVLGIEFDPFQTALADGRKVLDLVANHPATAEYICKKLCRRLVSDNPSKEVISGAADVWQKSVSKSDQIRQVVEFIALSDEFSKSWGEKVKRPLELVASYVRATGIEFLPTEGLLGEIEAAGQRLFTWPSPTGNPDDKTYWLSTNAMRRRWSLIMGVTDNWWKTGLFEPSGQMSGNISTVGQATHFWFKRLLGTAPDQQMISTILEGLGLAAGHSFDSNKHGESDKLLRHIIAFIAMSPEFQLK